jgi:hypothetical protein
MQHNPRREWDRVERRDREKQEVVRVRKGLPMQRLPVAEAVAMLYRHQSWSSSSCPSHLAGSVVPLHCQSLSRASSAVSASLPTCAGSSRIADRRLWAEWEVASAVHDQFLHSGLGIAIAVGLVTGSHFCRPCFATRRLLPQRVK